MNRDEKTAVIDEIASELTEAQAVFAVDYRGISVPQAAELRGKLREADASFSVTKNRLAKLAAEKAGTEGLDEHLVGPTALTYVRGDAVLAAKAIADFIKANQTINYKGGLMDGEPLDPDQFNSIARLPGVDTLRGQLVGLAASPITGVVRTLNQLVGGLASQLGQISEQGLVGSEAPAEEPKAEADEEATEPDAGKPEGADEAAVDAEPPAEADEPERAPEEEASANDEEATEADGGDATEGSEGGETKED